MCHSDIIIFFGDHGTKETMGPKRRCYRLLSATSLGLCGLSVSSVSQSPLVSLVSFVCCFVAKHREKQQSNKQQHYSLRILLTDERFLYPSSSAICWSVLPSSRMVRACSIFSSRSSLRSLSKPKGTRSPVGDKRDRRDRRGEVREVRECHLKLPKFSKFPETKKGQTDKSDPL